MTTVDIIVCTRNNKAIISEILNSIQSQSFKDFDCSIIDDNSTDGTTEFVRQKFPWVDCIKVQQCSGPSQNRNVAIRCGKAELIVTLDSDVRLESNWLESMVGFMESNPKIGVADSKLVPSTENTFYEDYACTAALIMKREVFVEVNGFDETFFYGLEDTDFSLRAKKKGWLVGHNYETIAWHRVNYTIKRMDGSVKRFHYWKNYIRLVLKNSSKQRLLWQLPALGIRLSVLFVKDVAVRKNALSIPKAVAWNVAVLSDTLRRRKYAQKNR